MRGGGGGGGASGPTVPPCGYAHGYWGMLVSCDLRRREFLIQEMQIKLYILAVEKYYKYPVIFFKSVDCFLDLAISSEASDL